MKEIIKSIKVNFLMTKCFIKRIYNNFVTKEVASDRGIEFYNYLTKVILEDYQPVSMCEYMFEGSFNKDGLTGEQRLARAYHFFFILAERLPFKMNRNKEVE